MENGECRHDPNVCRRHEAVIAETQGFLKEFIARYDADRAECRDRYRLEAESTWRWRQDFSDRLQKIELFIGEMKPNYARMMIMAGTVAIGAIAIVWRMIWSHVTGGK
jgi:hypothetical protein